MDPKLDELGTQIEQAAQAIARERAGGQEKAQAVLGAKSAPLTEDEVAELTRLRERVAEQERNSAVDTAAQTIALQIKSQRELEERNIQDAIDNRVKELLNPATNPAFEAAVRRAVPSLGRKTDPYAASGAAPAVLGYARGEKGGFRPFLFAIQRKDEHAIADMQRDGKLDYEGLTGFLGIKALIEGGAALSAVTGPQGGYLVPPEYAVDLIERLYAFVTIRSAGADTLPMQSPLYFQPRLSASASASYAGENQPIPNSQPGFDQFTLTAKELTGLVPISNLLLRDSNPNAERVVLGDIAKVMGLKEDLTFAYGAGSATVPQGIFGRSDIQIIPAVGTNGDVLEDAATGYDWIVDMETALDVANVPDVNRCWFMNPTLRGALRKVKDSQGRPIFTDYFNPQESTLLPGRPNAMQGKPKATLMGRPVFTSSQYPSYATGSTAKTFDLALAEMSEVVVGDLMGMEIAASSEGTFVDNGTGQTISAFQSNLTLYRAIARHDINLRHPEAVVVRKGLY